MANRKPGPIQRKRSLHGFEPPPTFWKKVKMFKNRKVAIKLSLTKFGTSFLKFILTILDLPW